MPESPRTRFTRPRAALVTGSRSRLIGGGSQARKARQKKPPIQHRLTYWHNSALCSCGWFLLDVARARSEEAFLIHKADALRSERRRSQERASMGHSLKMKPSRDPYWPSGHPKKRDASCGCGWQLPGAASAKAARRAYEKHLRNP